MNEGYESMKDYEESQGINEPEYLSEPKEDNYYESKFGDNYTGGYPHQDI